MDMTGTGFADAVFPINPPFPPLIQEVGATTSTGIPFGLPLSVPPGWAAVVSRGMQVLYVLAPGEYRFEPHYFPLLAPPKPKPGTSTLNGAIHLICTTDVPDVPWECGVTLTSDRRSGMTYCQLRGRFWGRVIDPGRFFASMLQIVGAGKDRDANAAANLLSIMALEKIGDTLGDAAVRGALEAGFAPAQWREAEEPLRAAAGQAAASQMASMGMQTLAFQIDEASDALRVPCAGCGSATAPTAYATFRRNVSLFYVRFGTEQSGNFCTVCAARRALTDNSIMLVCGWWGFVGLVLTPIYFVSNLYHLGAVLAGPKQSAEQTNERLFT